MLVPVLDVVVPEVLVLVLTGVFEAAPTASGVPARADTGMSPQKVKAGGPPETVWFAAPTQDVPFQYSISPSVAFKAMLFMQTWAVPVFVPPISMS